VTRVVAGSSEGAGLHVGIAAATWNQAITDKLVEGAQRRLSELGVAEVTLVRVPGALELPVAALKLAELGCDAVVAIGAVVKGDTDHYEIVVQQSASGVSRVSLDTGVPVTNAILAVREYSHAVDRAGPGNDNKGAEGAESAVNIATALRALGES
jgi:6,7-dimethyl-8-ribityllumazine synthase